MLRALSFRITLAFLVTWSVGSGTALAESPPVDAPLETHCAGQAATQLGFDPRTTPRPVPRTAARPPMPGAGRPPSSIAQPSVAQQQAWWDGKYAEFLTAYSACLATPRESAPAQAP